MRAGYYTMLIVIAAAMSAVAGLFVVWGGYWAGSSSQAVSHQ